MRTVAFVLHSDRPEAGDCFAKARRWLDERGHHTVLPLADAQLIGADDLGVDDDAIAQADLVVSLGGDGTMLRAVHLLGGVEVPLFGVNLGHLGYLTEVEPENLCPSLERFFEGRHQIEERMLVSVLVESSDPSISSRPHLGLNEVVIEKMLGHTIRIAVSFDGQAFTSYAADGLILATPTGSTAYSLSVRGPIVAPKHRALLLTPVAAHMLFDRTMVLDPGTEVTLEVLGPQSVKVMVDGRQLGELQEGDKIRCSASESNAHFVNFGTRDFHAVLKAKFGLADR